MKRNKFSLSHYKLFSADMGELIPCGMFEVLPGDTVQQATSLLLRVSPLVAPVMHPVHVRIHHWYVPLRLVWGQFEAFITGGPDGLDATVLPLMTGPGGGGYAVGSLADYLGIPTGVPSLVHSVLPFRVYARIWNEWYRDQDLQAEAVSNKVSGPDTTTNTSLLFVNWEKDYFTMARPWEQKGTTVTMPLGATAPVTRTSAAAGPTFTTVGGGGGANNMNAAAGTGVFALAANAPPSLQQATWGTTTGLMADLTTATAASISQLREAFALQRYKEARARYGSRFSEYLASAFGVRSSDARLDRPEYLGGGKQVIQFSEVLQTGVTTNAATPGVGNMAGHGISGVRSNRYRKFFEEHGYVMSFMSVQPKTMYTQGLARHWNRRIKEDFFQRELQHVGQMKILNKELYAAHASPDGTFGFQDRYDEYRRQESSVAGEFRSTLDYWHMARIFGSSPALNSAFVTSNPTKRVNQVQSADVLWVMANHSIQARRIVAENGAPGGI